MARRNYASRSYFQKYAGLNTESPPTLTPRVQLYRADNCRLSKGGVPTRRGGYTEWLGSAWGSYNIVSLADTYLSSAQKLFALGRNGAGTSAQIGVVQSAFTTAASIAAVATADASENLCVLQVMSQAMLLNGTVNKITIDGTTLKQIGITAPSGGASLAQTATGGALTNGTYLVCYTYLNSATGAESAISPSASITLSGGGSAQKITATVTAGSAATADTIQLWRTVVNGNQLFRAETAAISATSIDSVMSDAALAICEKWNTDLDNARPPTALLFGAVIGNRVFAVDSANRGRVVHSKIGENGPMYESFPASHFVDCEPQDNDKIVGISYVGDPTMGATPVVLKERSCGILREVMDNVFVYQRMIGAKGALSHWAVWANMAGGVTVWVGEDNIYATTDGLHAFTIADDIKSDVAALDKTYKKFWSIVEAPEKSEIHITCSRTSGAMPDMVLCGNYRNFAARQQLDWTKWTVGPDTTTYPSIKGSALLRVLDTDSAVHYLFGNSTADGMLYEYDDGLTDNGSKIYFRIDMPADDLGAPDKDKQFGEVNLVVSVDTSPESFSCYLRRPRSDELVQGRDITVDVGGFMLDEDYIVGSDSDADATYLAGSTVYRTQYNPTLRDKAASLTLVQDSTTSGFELWGHDFSAKVCK